MSTLADTGYPTMQDVMASLAPDGSVEMNMAEILNKELPMLDDIPWQEANGTLADTVMQRTALSTPTWRRLNAGVPPTKSSRATFAESVGILEDYSNVDVDVAKLATNPAAYRSSEDKGKLESFAQEAARAIWYEDGTLNPEKIHGVTPRYGGTSGYTTSSYVLKPGTNAGSNAHSIWLITWEPDKISGIYPKGSRMGLMHEDRGQQTIRDSNGYQFEAWVSHYQWKMGIRIADYRYAVRMQWDPDDSTLFGDDDKGMYLAMQDMLAVIKRTGPGSRFYMDRVSLRKLHAQIANNNVNYLDNIESKRGILPAFMGIPIRLDEQLTTESAIS